jgi:PTH1 family peptidyl-tRNA hydrolase
MHIIVGLGNPGKQYENTRHNAGFMAVEALAKELGLKWKNNKKFKADLSQGDDVILIKPLTFMNDSGSGVALALAYYKLSPEKLTVIHDDLDLELGKYKISLDSTSAGHKGVQSIIDQLKTKNFKRIRIGIKPSQATPMPAEKYVLQKFNESELAVINQIIKQVLKEL